MIPMRPSGVRAVALHEMSKATSNNKAVRIDLVSGPKQRSKLRAFLLKVASPIGGTCRFSRRKSCISVDALAWLHRRNALPVDAYWHTFRQGLAVGGAKRDSGVLRQPAVDLHLGEIASARLYALAPKYFTVQQIDVIPAVLTM
jgi:hypothetical protein